MTARQARLAASALVGGALLGAVAWSSAQHHRRRDLFHRRPLRRLAALSYLRGHPGPDTARLLHEYVRWEPRAGLRRRAEALLERIERHLD